MTKKSLEVSVSHSSLSFTAATGKICISQTGSDIEVKVPKRHLSERVPGSSEYIFTLCAV